MNDVDLVEYPEIFGKLFFVVIPEILILDKGTLFHPKLDAVAGKDEIKLLVLDELGSYFEYGSYFGEQILLYGSKHEFAYSNLAALMFVYLHALYCQQLPT